MNSIPTQTIDFAVKIIVEPDEGGFHAYCPTLKGLHVGGETEEEALQNAKDAAVAYLHSLVRHGEPILIGVTTIEPSETHKRGESPIHEHIEKLHLENLALTTA